MNIVNLKLFIVKEEYFILSRYKLIVTYIFLCKLISFIGGVEVETTLTYIGIFIMLAYFVYLTITD